MEEKIAIELSKEEWVLVQFLALRGTRSEMDRYITQPGSHDTLCIGSFARATKVLTEQLQNAGVLKATAIAPEDQKPL